MPSRLPIKIVCLKFAMFFQSTILKFLCSISICIVNYLLTRLAQECSERIFFLGPFWTNHALSVLSRSQAYILPELLSHLVNDIFIYRTALLSLFGVGINWGLNLGRTWKGSNKLRKIQFGWDILGFLWANDIQAAGNGYILVSDLLIQTTHPPFIDNALSNNWIIH